MSASPHRAFSAAQFAAARAALDGSSLRSLRREAVAAFKLERRARPELPPADLRAWLDALAAADRQRQHEARQQALAVLRGVAMPVGGPKRTPDWGVPRADPEPEHDPTLLASMKRALSAPVTLSTTEPAAQPLVEALKRHAAGRTAAEGVAASAPASGAASPARRKPR